MSLFEDWYITFNGGIENEEDILWALAKDSAGEYKEIVTFWMHKAFLAGQVLCEEPAPIPKELFERIDVIKKKAETNKLREQITTLDANTAFEMIENPPEPNEKLIELLRLG